jgi:uncharacterized protein
MRRLKRPAAVLVLTLMCGALGLEHMERVRMARATEPAAASAPATRAFTAGEHDSLHDGFPDAARILRPEDRATFVRWLTFLGEAQYYAPSTEARGEIHDCAGLIRFAFRNALMTHTSAWRRSVLAAQPGVAARIENEANFGDLQEFTYPDWVLGTDLFRTGAGPLAPGDLANGSFAQFADAATLLHFNTFFISRDVRAASPGDLFFYYQPGQHEAYHSMLFVGPSYFQPQGADWVVYHTGDINGQAGQVREVEVGMLMKIPDPRWRPLASNPRFLGVYRFELLR